jgi:hypothetical protein
MVAGAAILEVVAEAKSSWVETREWFVDDRSPVRRMQVAWHPSERLVILSLWQGDTCTGTFRLPIEDAPQLMHVLVDALGNGAVTPASRPQSPPSWLERIKRRLRPTLAEVVHLVDRRR